MLKVDILFELLPATTIDERIWIKNLLDKFSSALLLEEELIQDDLDEDSFYGRIYSFLEDEYFKSPDIKDTTVDFEMFKVFFDRLVVSSAGYWPNVYIGDPDNDRHPHEGVIPSLDTLKNFLNLMKSIYSMHFGGYNGIPFVYAGEEHSQLLGFSEN